MSRAKRAAEPTAGTAAHCAKRASGASDFAQRIAISEVRLTERKTNLRGGFREAAAGYSVLSDVIKSFCFAD